jgi:hypothetical protein
MTRPRPDPVAEALFGRDTVASGVAVTPETSERVALFQAVLQQTLGLRRKPSQRVAAGYLLREGLRLVRDGIEPAHQDPGSDRKHLMLLVDRSTWARAKAYIAGRSGAHYVELPLLIELALDFQVERLAAGKTPR